MSMMSRWIALAAIVTVFGAVGGARTSPAPLVGEERQHRSSLTAKVTLLNGTTRTVTLEGVGCSSRMCSRISVNGTLAGASVVSRTWLDSISMIRDVTRDDALLVFKDGSERRLSVVPLNRVVYLKGRLGGYERLDLAQVRSLEFNVTP
jgi:hypothetical protein